MWRIWLTARFEARTHLRRRFFWIMTFVLPAAVVVAALLVQAFSGGAGTSVISGVETQGNPIGYVDTAGLLQDTPTNLPAGLVHSYPDEEEARQAVVNGDIDRYYVVAPDYLTSGRLTVVQNQYQPLRGLEGSQLITYVIDTGITGDQALAALLIDPTPGLTATAAAPGDAPVSGGASTAYLLPYLLMFILYMALAMTSGFMLQSVSREKENRTAEMLLVSLPPRQMMLGKIAGLSAVGLLQVAIWLAAFFGVLSSSGGLFGVDIQLGGSMAAHVIPWTIAYFLLGYLMYASVYATFGVLAPSLRDANHFVFIAIVPLVIPLIFNQTFGTAPDGVLATTLSLVPFTSPIAMIARLGAASVPWWQSLAGLVALGLFAYGFVLMAARLFRAENILSSRALTWARLRSELAPASAGSKTGSPPRAVRAHEGDDISTTGSGRGGWGGRRPGSGTGGQQPAGAKQRLYLSVGVAVVLVIVGVFTYVRGDKAGIAVAIAGVVVGLITYSRLRKS